ncbi:VCBS repeat-containing protein [Puia dinghuensis]|uniref:ASPIC/UnbV domain-containing protein n=1 Tax=Puia dinghuensis TaxID=1792502 RepID=A0A8J2UAJ1_9BACT|nr:VCBS repeat-containing protein [Puia dinghuensis]GGA90652.1 hypothetical protein GCM10011511_12410 [Puia dinghuensis]
MKIGIAGVLLYAAVACHRPEPALLTVLPSSQTHIDFSNDPEKRPGLGILEYIYYYNGGGVAIGDINNDGLPDIYFTANSKGRNKLYLNKGNFVFEDITERAGVAGTADWCTGATMADVNGDGLLDIYVCAVANTHGLKGHNELFINNGDGTFTESSALYGLDFAGYSTQAAFFDYDHDGDLDCFLLNHSEHPNQNIVDTSNRRRSDPYAGGRLFRNDGVNGRPKFTDVTAEAGIYQSSLCYGLGLGVGDLDNDGWDDVYVGNDFHENDYYYHNEGNGRFAENGAGHFRHYSRYSMGNDIADFNNDGQPDIFTADMLPGEEKTLKSYGNGEHLDTYYQKITRNGFQDQYSRNCLQRNNGNGASFSDVGLIAGVGATDWSWSPLLADLDNDGDKDLFVSSGIVRRPLDLDFILFYSNIRDPREFGSPEDFEKALMDKMPDGASHPFLFRGNGDLGFRDVSAQWGTADMRGYFNGAAYADLDNDGRLDLVINCLNTPAVVLRNEAPKKHYLSLGFKGKGMNTAGIGAKAWIFAGGKLQYQESMATRGFLSSSDTRLHFGLDTLREVDSLLVVWPDQKYQLLRHVQPDRQLVLRQVDAVSDFAYRDFFPARKPVMRDISDRIHTGWRHKEDPFIDFKTHYLIPHMESTRGPRLAVADVNKDGLDDIFVCGARGQPGVLLVQTKEGNFVPVDTAVFSRNAASEGVDAVFVDVNGDGYPDLYVVSGGNEYANGDPALADHLYLNDGKGHFSESVGALPAILTNKSCVAVADVNGDGSPDLFVGGLADADRYGYPVSSHLLVNDGRGKFREADRAVIDLKGIGMVTSGVFADINHDGWPDLVVAGEWMPLKLFINHRGVYSESDIGGSTGLWQSLLATDVNGDGYTDILAGNWGHNSKLYAGKDGPLKLYVKDFDGNGTTQQVMTYAIGGKEYPFLGKDFLELALPGLKKNHLTYGEVAGESVQYLFGNGLDGAEQLSVETLGSACFINDGKGNFVSRVLPDELQLAPVFTFAPFPMAGGNAYFAAGDFYGVQPFEGRYDALNPTVFWCDKGGRFGLLGQLPGIAAEARDAKWIGMAGGKKVLVLAVNNGPLVFLEPAM